MSSFLRRRVSTPPVFLIGFKFSEFEFWWESILLRGIWKVKCVRPTRTQSCWIAPQFLSFLAGDSTPHPHPFRSKKPILASPSFSGIDGGRLPPPRNTSPSHTDGRGGINSEGIPPKPDLSLGCVFLREKKRGKDGNWSEDMCFFVRRRIN